MTRDKEPATPGNDAAQKPGTTLALLLFLALAFCVGTGIIPDGCGPITKEEVSGVYVCSKDGVIDTIVLNTNGTFDQTITTTNAGPWSLRGSWKLNPETVDFEPFYEAFEIERANGADKVIPPQKFSTSFLWIQKGTLQMDVSDIFPIWRKQTANTQGVTNSSAESLPHE
ncbi:MAG TPA: hypothetical protein VKV04_00170 [Verrucomicrobiae bacterium]|nr:hypothetical protein [Verrucomicrobiae bacterium]